MMVKFSKKYMELSDIVKPYLVISDDPKITEPSLSKDAPEKVKKVFPEFLRLQKKEVPTYPF